MGLACVDVLSLEGSYCLDLHSHLVECFVERYLCPSSSATRAALFLDLDVDNSCSIGENFVFYFKIGETCHINVKILVLGNYLSL